MRRNDKSFAAFFGAALLGLCSMNASAVMIDNFGPADGTVSADETNTTQSLFLDATGGGQILGGERDLLVYATATGSDPLSVSGAVSGGSFIVQATGSINSFGGAAMDYDGNDDNSNANTNNQFNLSAGGADRFLIDVLGVSGGLNISLFAEDANDNVFEHLFSNISSTGLLEVKFSDMTPLHGNDVLDWAKVGRIKLSINDAGTDEFIELGYFCTGSQAAGAAASCTSSQQVPEPATLALLAAGLLGLRRRPV